MNDTYLTPVILWLVAAGAIMCFCLGLSKLASYLIFKRVQSGLANEKSLIHEYAAPKDLSVAEFGYIFDRKIRDNEVLATIISLGQVGALSLSRNANDLVVAHSDDHKPKRKLDNFELEIIGLVKELGVTCTYQTIANRVTAGSEVQYRLQQQVLMQLESKGYVLRSTLLRVLSNGRKLFITIGLVLSLLFVAFPVRAVLMYQNSTTEPGYAALDQSIVIFMILSGAVVLWPLWYYYAKLLGAIIYHGSGYPIGATSKLKEQWRQIVGYKIFLNRVEVARLSADPSLTDKTLPWCISVTGKPQSKYLQ